VRDGTLAHASFANYMRPVRREVERRLEAGQSCGVPKTEGVCREILKRRQALWMFVRHAGVEPTNNAAERAIRPGVLWRQGSCGTQSPEGSRVVDTMMTVVAPLQQQPRHVLASVTAACEAALRGEAAPSLLPLPAATEHRLCPATSLDHIGERLLWMLAVEGAGDRFNQDGEGGNARRRHVSRSERMRSTQRSSAVAVFLWQASSEELATPGTICQVQDHPPHVHLDLRQLKHLVRIVGSYLRKLPLTTLTGFRLDLEDLRRRQQRLAMA
jgi:Transposase IS66 family